MQGRNTQYHGIVHSMVFDSESYAIVEGGSKGQAWERHVIKSNLMDGYYEGVEIKIGDKITYSLSWRDSDRMEGMKCIHAIFSVNGRSAVLTEDAQREKEESKKMRMLAVDPDTLQKAIYTSIYGECVLATRALTGRRYEDFATIRDIVRRANKEAKLTIAKLGLQSMSLPRAVQAADEEFEFYVQPKGSVCCTGVVEKIGPTAGRKQICGKIRDVGHYIPGNIIEGHGLKEGDIITYQAVEQSSRGRFISHDVREVFSKKSELPTVPRGVSLSSASGPFSLGALPPIGEESFEVSP